MARSMWSGSISFGLVNVPVKLYPAVSSKDVRFHQLEEGTGARIRQKRVSAETGEEMPYERIVKAYEISPDRYVMITPRTSTPSIPPQPLLPLVRAAIDPSRFASAFLRSEPRELAAALDGLTEAEALAVGRP